MKRIYLLINLLRRIYGGALLLGPRIRPIQFLAYALSYKLFGLDTFGHHLLNGIFVHDLYSFT